MSLADEDAEMDHRSQLGISASTTCESAMTRVSGWSRPLRTIHLLLAVTVTAQLFIGSFMRSPHPSQSDSIGFAAHEIVGATILTLIILHWAWSLSHPNEGLHHLFPWTRQGLRRVVDELWEAVRFRHLPPGGPSADAGLAGFVHGLGLLAISAMALIGGSFYLSRLAGVGWNGLRFIEDIHDAFAVLVWTYWGGHLAATIVHESLGQPVVRRMFGWRG